jgi:hypothetical protein
MSKLMTKQPSKKLLLKLDEVVKNFQNCATLVYEAFTLGKEEGFSEKEIGRMMRENLAKLGYDPRSIRRALPPSAKDMSKTRKDFLSKNQVNPKDEPDEDILSSLESRNVTDENHQTIPTEIAKPLQDRIDVLEGQLKHEQSKNEDLQGKYEDLSIRRNNLAAQVTQLWNQLHNEAVRTLILTGEKFPLNSGQVFESRDHVFFIEFNGTKVLDISVMTQQQAHDLYMNEEQITKAM